MKQLSQLLIAVMLLAVSCTQDNAEFADATGKSGSITRFAVHNNYMYVLNLNEVQTYSLANADKPVLVHRLPTDYGLETIIVYDNTIFLGSRTSLYILGIDNPAAPVLLSQTSRVEALSRGCDPVVVKDNFAYSTIKIIANVCGQAAAQSALLVYDVSDRTTPIQVGIYPLSLPNGLGYKDNYLFVCDEGSDRLEVFDISNPRSLQLTDYSVPITDPFDLIVYGEKMLVSTKTDFQIYDLSDITAIRRIGLIEK
ncbi:MAG: hypothetical protein KIS77_14750 [Saprospiraceae bacterium]|nr:hypothetical protein [Saprospiraceae bacterium]